MNGVPRKLRKEIANHEVRTVTESGWSGMKNGELLALAEPEFDVFFTVDPESDFSAVQYRNYSDGARNNRFKTLLPLMPEVNAAMEEVKPGELARIGES